MDKMSFASNLVVKSSGRQMCGLAFPNDIGGDKVAESRWHIGHGAYTVETLFARQCMG